MRNFNEKKERAGRIIKGKFRKAPTPPPEPEASGRRFSFKERRELERQFFGRKWRKRGEVSKEEYEERLKRFTRARLKAKTPEDKLIIKRKIKYLKKIGRPKIGA